MKAHYIEWTNFISSKVQNFNNQNMHMFLMHYFKNCSSLSISIVNMKPERKQNNYRKSQTIQFQKFHKIHFLFRLVVVIAVAFLMTNYLFETFIFSAQIFILVFISLHECMLNVKSFCILFFNVNNPGTKFKNVN